MSHSASQTRSPAPTIPGRRTFLQWLTYATGAVAAAVLAVPFVGLSVRGLAEAPGPMGQAGTAEPIPTQRDPTGDVSESTGPAVGRYGSSYGSLRPQPGSGRQATGSVPGFRHELRSPGLPCDLVPAVWPLHVSVSWRRLLRERRTRCGAAAAGPVPLRLAGPRRTTGDPGAAPAHLAEHPGQTGESVRIGDEANSGMAGSPLEPA